ncbi:MAG: four helix bundle protein [Bacteroidota bacterium]
MKKKNEVLDISFNLAVKIIELSEELEQNKKFVIARQILRSGTSIGANIREAQSAESKADFIHKLKIAHKEALETEYWLDLIKISKSYPSPSPEISETLISVTKLLNSIISSSKK